MIKQYSGTYRRGLLLFFCLAVLMWMGLIFCFSAQPAEESTELSHSVGRKIGEWFVPGFSEWEAERQEQFSESVDFYVRKSAHASEYAVLSILFLGALYFSGKRLRVYPAAIFLTAAYAATDEIHQLFVPGRSGQVSDVVLDSLGAFAGCFFVYFVQFSYKKFKKQKNE